MAHPLRTTPHPLLLQVPARPWIRRISDAAGRPVGLGEVPDAVLDGFAERGFHGVWLMGVWTTGPGGRRLALGYPDLLATYERMVPDWEPRDVGGSPYSIRAYEPPAAMGGLDGLARLRERLRERGLGLVLDFVPNHVSFDHPWLDERPELLVRGTARDLARDPQTWFVHTTPDGRDRIFAHGRDPHFPGWSDTAQIDYRLPEARAAMADVVRDLAGRCDGLRCDMAMLVLEDVFRGTWGETDGGTPEPFWKRVIPAVRAEHPELLLIAEVYWGLEGRLRDVGFDYTYDKDLYDKLVAGDVEGVRYRLRRPLEEQAHCVRFLENHDEPRAAETLGVARLPAAAAVAYSLPGLRFFQEGQAEGHRLRPPVQLARAPHEAPDPGIEAIHARIFALLADERLHGGAWGAIEPQPDAASPVGALVASRWAANDRTVVIVANLGAEAARGRLVLPLAGDDGPVAIAPGPGDAGEALPDLAPHAKQIREDGFPVEVAAHEFRVLDIDRGLAPSP